MTHIQTRYSALNVEHGTKVYDVDRLECIDWVLRIDTDDVELVIAHYPVQVTSDGKVDTYTLKFRSIYPIFGGYKRPCLFHCYGRIE